MTIDERACPRPDKVKFTHKWKAKKKLKQWLGKRVLNLHVYRCDCGYWHVGHKRGGIL